MTAKANCHASINFEETELRLGLPGGADFEKDADENSKLKISGKRGFSETDAVDLKLHLSNSSTTTSSDKSGRVDRDDKEKVADNVTPSAKAQAVGWPPVRSFRKNAMDAQKANTGNSDSDKAAPLVKVSMDGAPYLRKVDLKMYKSYKELSHALATMFSSFTSEKKDLISHSKLIDPLNDSGFVPTYEDKDGDWMLVGDVPWEMFVESCKRMRIMTKGSETL